MNRYRTLLVAVWALLLALPLLAAPQQEGGFEPRTSSPPDLRPVPRKFDRITAYTLPPDIYKMAHERNRIRFHLALISFVYGLIVLWLILGCKLAAQFRGWAEKCSSWRIVQGTLFACLFFLTIAVLDLPFDVYGEWVEKHYGISKNGWGWWINDWIKGEAVTLILASILVWLLYAVIRRSPRRWWFYFWLVSLPAGVFLVYLQPLVIDPLFHKFAPLQQKDPALVAALQPMVQRAGEDIPPERMFWMGAGEKTTAVDAYVTGVGQSKRIVVWDNTIVRMNTPQIVYVLGHETGHYVLHHIVKGLTFLAVLLLLFFYVLHRLIGWVLARWGGEWGIRGLDDWASLPVLLFLLSILFFLANPVACAFSRHLEHQADQFGLEVTHGLTPDFSQVGAQAFQVLGEVDLSDPDPNPLQVFLYYTHDPIAERVRFCLTYNPWDKGGTGEFVN